MNTRLLAMLAGTCGAAALVLAVRAAEPPDPRPGDTDRGVFDQEAVLRATTTPAAQAGVEPQGRGPVHEAFAEATVDRPQPGPVVPKQPPEAIEELPPAQKPEGDDVQWVSGYWAWDDERSDFLWVTGIWRSIPPGRQWVPGHWAQVQGGSQWQVGFWAAAGGDVQVVPAPPDPKDETPPPAPAPAGATTPPAAATTADSTYVSGNYVYTSFVGSTDQDNAFVWHPGYYVTNRAGWVWVPAHYVYTPAGYVFVDGYWDYDLQNRGLLFAPVVIDARYRTQPDWVYTPVYVVHDACLLDALFVRTGSSCYHFGDYFDQGYAGLGFVSFADHRFGRQGYDPLFSYYRWAHRQDQGWERGVRRLYTARSQGLVVRPPRTLEAQQKLAVRLLAGQPSRAALQHSVMLAPLAQVDRKVVKLQTLDRAGQLEHRKAAEQQRTVSRQREQVESGLVAQGQSAIRKGGTAQTLALNLPKAAPSTKPGAGRTAPPPPPGRGNDRPTANGATPGAGNRPGTNNSPGTPAGTKVNAGAGNAAAAPGGGKVNANPANSTGTPAGTKVNPNPGNPAAPATGTKPNANPAAGTPVNTKVNPSTTPNVPAGTPVGTKVNPKPDTPAGPPGGAKVNTPPANPAGTPSGNRPPNPGATTPVKPAGNPPPAGGNGGSRPNGGAVRPATVSNPPARVRSSVEDSQVVSRVQRTLTPPSGPRVTNPAPAEIATPPSRPAPTFSTSPSRVPSAPPGGGRPH
jgi:hypothetical protein